MKEAMEQVVWAKTKDREQPDPIGQECLLSSPGSTSEEFDTEGTRG